MISQMLSKEKLFLDKSVAAYYSKREVTEAQLLAFAKNDEEMAQEFIEAGVKGILVGGDAETNTGEPAMSNDYMASMVEELEKKWVKIYALRRLGDVQDSANMIVFLSSKAADWITEQSISVNGGYFMG
jgi:NAD(P)-dependent dehydrogenase (short-subunit alcohol dehydrogenase family)